MDTSVIRMQAIKYQQGSRTMYVTAASPSALVKMSAAPQLYDPHEELRPGTHGNRNLDKDHVQGIVVYLEDEPNFVIGSLTLYLPMGTINFEPMKEDLNLGWISIPLDAHFEIGDGQHRLRAFEHVFRTHRDEHDSILQNIRNSGLPAIIVEEDDPVKRMQDFVDLQRNGKPLSPSLGATMDRRLQINRLSLDVAKTIKLFHNKKPGDRIEYMSHNLSKLSPHVYTFASWRWAIGTILIGFGHHERRKWEQATEKELKNKGYDKTRDRLSEIFEEASLHLPGWKDVVQDDMRVQEFREQYVLGSAAGLTAFAGAMHKILSTMDRATSDQLPLDMNQTPPVHWKEAIRQISQINWLKEGQKSRKPFFEGTIVQRGHVLNTRPMFEEAATRLYEKIVSKAPVSRVS